MSLSNRSLKLLTAFSLSLALVCVGVVIGAVLPKKQAAPQPEQGIKLSPVSFLKDTAARSDNISIATGAIDEGLEAMFILDHGAGTLQCWFVNPRTGILAGAYATNVSNAFGGGRASDKDFVMATGYVDFSVGKRGNIRAAKCICYVAENNSGKIAGYGLEYDPRGVTTGGFQTGELKLLFNQFIRNSSLKRDQN